MVGVLKDEDANVNPNTCLKGYSSTIESTLKQ